MPARLLVVDDEAALLNLVKRYLERIGYLVDTFQTAEPALEAYGADPARFQLVIADLTLREGGRGMNGEEMLARMRELNPSLRGVLCSGIPYEPQLPGIDFLQKPFLPDMLAQAVDAALGTHGKTAARDKIR